VTQVLRRSHEKNQKEEEVMYKLGSEDSDIEEKVSRKTTAKKAA
jgi:hypothetical protein